MRSQVLVAPSVFVGIIVGWSALAQANLALTLNSHASISSLSVQLLAKPRTAAGDKKNVWDSDPAVPAVTGEHYFLYNIDANNNPLVGARVVTLTGVQWGPGYSGTVEVLVQSTAQPQLGPPQFIEADANGNINTDNYRELGLARVTFAQNGAPTGQIQESDDIELAYAASDVNGNPSNVRGTEQVRFITEYLGHDAQSDSAVARAEMTTVVPSSFDAFAPAGQTFDPGFLSFGNDDVSIGSNVYSAAAQTNPLAQTWISAAGGTWEGTTHWQDGTIADGTNMVARFTALDLNGVITVTNGQSRVIGGMTFGDTDTSTPGSYQITGAGLILGGTTPTITIGDLASTARPRVDNVLSGTASLTVVGSNVPKAPIGAGLVLTAINTYAGGTTLQNATVYVGAPVSAPSSATIGATGGNVALNGYNYIANGTNDGSFKVTLNNNFIANAGSTTTFVLGHIADFGISGAVGTAHRTVTGTGTIVLTPDSNTNSVRVFSDFMGFTGHLAMNGLGGLQFSTATSGATPGFVGTGFGGAAVSCDGSVSVAFNNSGPGAVNFGSLSGSSSTAGFTGGSAGAPNLTIGSLNMATTFAGFISGNNAVTKVGLASLALTGHNTYSGTTSVNGGTLVLGSSAQEPVLGGATVTTPAGADIKGGVLMLQYAGGTSPATTVKSILTSGYAQGTKFSTGLLRSTLLPAHRTLGWTDQPGNSQVEVAFTLPGDADLDFNVGFSDLLVLAKHYNTASGAVWSTGDFNYNGSVEFNDLLLLAQSYSQGLSDSETAEVGPAFANDYALARSLVPEPGMLSLLGLGMLGIRRHPRR